MRSIEEQVLYILARSFSMDTAELVRIYSGRGFTSQSVRNALSHLKAKGFVETPMRSIYRATELGRSFIRQSEYKLSLYDMDWDGTWHFVVPEIPEPQRIKRNRLRTELLGYGFAALYKSFYVSPWPYADEINSLIQELEITDFVTLVKGSILTNTITPSTARDLWKLDQIELFYLEADYWFEHVFLKELGTLNKSEHLAVFLKYLELDEVIHEVSQNDPMLPESLLLPTWRGKQVLTKLMECRRTFFQFADANSEYGQFMV